MQAVRHVGTPDHDAITAAFISDKYFPVCRNYGRKNTQGAAAAAAAAPGALFKLSWLRSSRIAEFLFSHVVL